MGICCHKDKGRKLWLAFECIGKGKEDIWTYEKSPLREPLGTVIKRMGINFEQIYDVTYKYETLYINNTIQQLNIPEGGVLTIKLK